ncbi:MAG: helix-turn-helix domain-containing protein [Clostridia bacterium]|nr:helix-turn-helix domain-containing protein [Clostridia bacterium]
MQIEHFTHLSLFRIFKYSTEKGASFDFLKAPRPCYFLAAMLEGEAVFESDRGEKHRIKKGDLLFIPQGAKYRSFWGETRENVYISVHFDFEPMAGFCDPETLPLQKVSIENAQDLAEDLLCAYRLFEKSTEDRLMALSIFYAALSSILPHLKRAPLPANDRRLSPATDHIRTHLDEDTPAATLASLCHMSEPNLYLLFRRQLGETPVEYKNRLRIERAQQLLLAYPDMPIEQVADATGFESAAYFRRRFKEALGKSPREYRKGAGEGL